MYFTEHLLPVFGAPSRSVLGAFFIRVWWSSSHKYASKKMFKIPCDSAPETPENRYAVMLGFANVSIVRFIPFLEHREIHLLTCFTLPFCPVPRRGMSLNSLFTLFSHPILKW